MFIAFKNMRMSWEYFSEIFADVSKSCWELMIMNKPIDYMEIILWILHFILT